MKLMLNIVAVALATLSMAAQAADPSPAQKAQQEKMAACNKDATDKKGDDRKAFMKTCLAAQSPAAAACDKQAAEKKLAGAAKNSFTKKCIADAK